MFYMLKIAKVEESSDFRENTEKRSIKTFDNLICY